VKDGVSTRAHLVNLTNKDCWPFLPPVVSALTDENNANMVVWKIEEVPDSSTIDTRFGSDFTASPFIRVKIYRLQ
jgi:hypothetical protein